MTLFTTVRALQNNVQQSTATHLQTIGHPQYRYRLQPAPLHGCVHMNNAQVSYPLEPDYRYAEVDPKLFKQVPGMGMMRWQPLLPPLVPELSMQEGGTPLVTLPGIESWCGAKKGVRVFIKDESRNPTMSHKDRLNFCTVSAAVMEKAPGIVVASSGNHGASAAAYAARAGLPCIVLMSKDAPSSIRNFIQAYGAYIRPTESRERWPLMNRIQQTLGYYPVSNLTPTHTGHPYASEGYKTIAYEIVLQRGGVVPHLVIVPTGYAELLYGLAKGFREMKLLGITKSIPRLVSCEPQQRAPLALAWERGIAVAHVHAAPTQASSIATTVGGVRGTQAMKETNGIALRITDREMAEAQRRMGLGGIWAELSAAASVAGLKKLPWRKIDGEVDVVCISTSSGFKYHAMADAEQASLGSSLRRIQKELLRKGIR